MPGMRTVPSSVVMVATTRPVVAGCADCVGSAARDRRPTQRYEKDDANAKAGGAATHGPLGTIFESIPKRQPGFTSPPPRRAELQPANELQVIHVTFPPLAPSYRRRMAAAKGDKEKSQMIRRMTMVNLGLVAVQPFSAGFLMSGFDYAAAVHAVVANALQIGAIIQAVTAIVMWRRRRVPGWVAASGVGLFLIVFLQAGVGYNREVLAARADRRRPVGMVDATGKQAGRSRVPHIRS